MASSLSKSEVAWCAMALLGTTLLLLDASIACVPVWVSLHPNITTLDPKDVSAICMKSCAALTPGGAAPMLIALFKLWPK